MAMVKWEPWHDMEEMFDRYFKHARVPVAGSQEAMASGDWLPRVDISENEVEFQIKAEIPEVRKEDVNVSVDQGVMTLRGERKQEKEEKGKKFHRIERSYGSFTRSFTLPDNVDASKTKATFKDGVLTVQLPKTAENRPKSIEVAVD